VELAEEGKTCSQCRLEVFLTERHGPGWRFEQVKLDLGWYPPGGEDAACGLGTWIGASRGWYLAVLSVSWSLNEREGVISPFEPGLRLPASPDREGAPSASRVDCAGLVGILGPLWQDIKGVGQVWVILSWRKSWEAGRAGLLLASPTVDPTRQSRQCAQLQA
jgi:hypothetical protein